MHLLFITAAFGTLAVILYRRWRGRHRLPLPPGPKRLPLVGNILDISYDGKHAWHPHGDPNNVKATTELLEKRSTNYSDRPDFPMVNDLMGWGWDLAHMKYSDWWRLHRKTFHQYFQPRAVSAYQPIQLKATTALLKGLLESPEEYAKHIRHHSGSVILRVVYGYEVQPGNDFYVGLADEAMRGLVQAVNVGSFMVDFLPVLKHIPSWLPGMKFKRQTKVWAKSAYALKDSPFRLLKASIADGTAIPSFASENLGRLKDSDSPNPEMEEVIKNCAGIAYLGVCMSDTTVSVVLSFILAMVLNPAILARAQAQLDSVVGTRLPTFEDRPHLPYLDAIVSETLRWNPVTPLALPHSCIKEDQYNGYYIPAGSTVVGNAWAILHDPQPYPDPLSFKPERFLKENGKELPPDPINFAFGFGRRICPGRYLALNAVWIAIASILATYDITKAVDENGRPVTPVVETTGGVVTHPVPFKCTFTPRSAEALNLINNGHGESSV